MALEEGLTDNQKAITEDVKQYERLADMKELPQIEYDDNDEYYGTSDNYYDYFLQEKQSEEEPKKL